MRKYSLYIGKNVLHSSDKEIKDLLIAWFFISIAFAIVRSTGIELSSFLSKQFSTLILISAVTVGLGFLLHELAHKIVAQRYKCWAEFRADLSMLVMALFMSFLGFVFIAPGAVMIYGHINKKQNGIISAAGPETNIVIAIILLPLLFMEFSNPFWREVVNSGFLINAWLALFNMIPFWNFDGAKIWRWSKPIFISMAFFAAILLFIFFVRAT
jgi:Zn-dependent protease